MRRSEIESWALEIIEAVERGDRVEDFRVEVKARFIDHWDAARRIAGHANAGHGEPILWVIGVDERNNSIVDIDYSELSNWFAQVKSHFDDDVYPDMVDVNIRHENHTLVALLFYTDRAPYVVKNRDGGIPEREVPWREATALRTAKRNDLLRLLYQKAYQPITDPFGGSLLATQRPDGRSFEWVIEFETFIYPTNDKGIVIPVNKSEVVFRKNSREIRFDDIHYDALGYPEIETNDDVIIINGPGKLRLYSSNTIDFGGEEDLFYGDGILNITMLPYDFDYPISIEAPLTYQMHIGANSRGRTLRWFNGGIFEEYNQ